MLWPNPHAASSSPAFPERCCPGSPTSANEAKAPLAREGGSGPLQGGLSAASYRQFSSRRGCQHRPHFCPMTSESKGHTEVKEVAVFMAPPGMLALLCICKPLLASRILIKSLSECLSSWGGPELPGGALSSGCENTQTIGLVPRKCHLVCLTWCLAEEERRGSCLHVWCCLHCLPGRCKWYSNLAPVYRLLAHTPQQPSSKWLMGTCVLSIFIRLGEQGDGRLNLRGLKSLFSGDVLLSEMIVIPSGSSMAVALTCLDALLHGGPGTGYMALPVPSIQPEGGRPRNTTGLLGGRVPSLSSWWFSQELVLAGLHLSGHEWRDHPQHEYCWDKNDLHF